MAGGAVNARARRAGSQDSGAVGGRVEALVGPVLAGMGYEVVRVQLLGSDGQRSLQIMIERADRVTITVEDCAAASRAVSAILDAEDPVAGAYRLEMSSPGLDRPLTRLEHFRRFAGYEARIEADEPVDGRKRFKGPLRGIEEDRVLIEDADGRLYAVPFASIGRAKLVLTEALLAEAAAEQGGAR